MSILSFIHHQYHSPETLMDLLINTRRDEFLPNNVQLFLIAATTPLSPCFCTTVAIRFAVYLKILKTHWTSPETIALNHWQIINIPATTHKFLGLPQTRPARTHIFTGSNSFQLHLITVIPCTVVKRPSFYMTTETRTLAFSQCNPIEARRRGHQLGALAIIYT